VNGRDKPGHDGGYLGGDCASNAPLLLARGIEALRANDVAAAVELLSRAAVDPQAQFQLGVALQAAGRHADALESFRQAQAALADDPAPFLHAAVSHLALGEARAALHAASEACWRAPELATAHYAYGQAWAALGEAQRAEQAFAAAVRLNPRWADAWVNCGLSRYRQGAIEGAKVAMREALRYAPDHGAAKDNLAALLRMGGDGQPAMSAAPEARAPPAVDRGERRASRPLDSGQRPGAEDDAVLSYDPDRRRRKSVRGRPDRRALATIHRIEVWRRPASC
jgi:tetratricopeptide (TPR) repeat protein